MEKWNPWRDLRSRRHLRLVWEDLPAGVRGLYVPSAGGAEVVLSTRLDRRTRNSTLGHELIHDERGIVCSPDAPERWRPVMAREERRVDAENARRLVPLRDLREVVEALAEMQLPIEVWDIANQFDVPEHVAMDALRQLVS